MKTAIPVRRQSHSHMPASARPLLISGALAFALLGLTGCASAQAEEDPAPATSEPPQAETTTQGANEKGTQSPDLEQHTSGLVPGFSLSELLEKSELIVDGVVQSTSDAFLVEPVDGAMPQFFRDVYFKAETTYAGTPKYVSESNAQQSLLTLRIEGGAGAMITTNVEPVPTFEKGERYLLFLYQADDGSNYNTEGNHYYVIGVCTGAWLWSEEKAAFENPVMQSDEKEYIDGDTLRQKIAEAPFPVGVERADLGVNARMSEIEESYREGSLPQELYDHYVQLAEKESSTFSRIMTPEEQQAYEQEEAAKRKEYSSSTSS